MSGYVDPATAPSTDAVLESVDHVVDGDSVVVTRLITVGTTDDLVHLARDRAPRELRLVLVDTPERADHAAWTEAKADLRAFLIGYAPGALHVRTYGRDDFGRLLADVYDPATGFSASRYLMQVCGWPPYIP